MEELSISDLYAAIDKRELWGNSYVFDPNEMKWVTLNEITLFKKLGMSFKNSSDNFKKPKRIPAAQQSKSIDPETNLKEMETHYLEDYISVFQTQIDKLLENNLKLVDENIAFQVKNSENKAEFELLKFQSKLEVQKLTHECESLKNDLKDHIKLVEEQRKEIRRLRTDYQAKQEEQHNQLTELFSAQTELMEKNNKLSEQYQTKNKNLEMVQEELYKSKKDSKMIIESWKEKYRKDFKALKNEWEKERKSMASQLESMQSQYKAEVKELEMKLEIEKHKNKGKTSDADTSRFESIIQEKDKKIKELQNKQKLIATKYKEDFSKAQKTFESYQSVIHKQKQKEQDLSTNVIQLNHNLEQVKGDLELERSKAHRLELLMNQQESLNEIADEKVKVQDEFVAFKELGKLFEISNAKHWEIRADIYKDMKFTLKQMREMINQGELDEESFVRREGKWWKKAKEVHELFLELREREENGETRYYIERQSLRVPCGDKVEIETEKAKFTGVCINISTGGSLIHVPDMNTYSFKMGDEVTVAFVSESLLFEFEIVGTIRNVDATDKTLGLQFDGISDEEFDTIAFYIDGFADKLEEEAA